MKIKQILGLAVSFTLALAYAPLTVAQEEAVDEIITEEESQAAMEEIVAVGIRGSLQAAADLKRNDARISDAIVAEDIGKLPDNNIAEALQRVTGVSLTRDFGIGEGVSIRGLPQNRIEINGRTTSGEGRDGVSLDDFPSAFLSSVEVIKSPTADMIEGALGGTVRMNTRRPLDLDERLLYGALNYEYSDKAEEWAPIINASYGDIWDLETGGQFGAIVNFSYTDRTVRRDVTHGREEMFDASANLNGMVSNGPSDLFLIRNQHTLEQDLEQREHTALNLTLQWSPASGDGQFYLDVTQSERDGSNYSNSVLEVGGINNLPIGDPNSSFTAETYQDENGQLHNVRMNDTFAIPKSQLDFRKTDTISSALGFDFDLSERLNISGEVAHSKSNTVGPGANFDQRPINQAAHDAWIASFADAAEFEEAFNQNGINDRLDSGGDPISFNNAFDDDCRPNYDCRDTFDMVFYQNGSGAPGVDFLGSDTMTNPANQATRAFGYNEELIDNEEMAMRLDMDLAEPFGVSWISSLKAGIRLTENAFDYNEMEWATGSSTYRRAFDNDTGMPVVVWQDTWEAQFPGSFKEFNPANTFSQAGLSGSFDLTPYRLYGNLQNPQKVWEQFQYFYGNTNYGESGTLRENMELDQNSYRDITESTGAIYLSAEMDWDRVSAVLGARYVTTDIESTTFVDGQLSTGTNDYSDLLPSLNVTFALTDNTQLRFAAAEVMRRPDYEILSSAFNVNGNLVTATQGALDLDPYRATQFDLSVEHYFEEGGLVAFALFYKDVESFLTSTTTCLAHPMTFGDPPQNVTEWKDVCLLNTAGQSQDDLMYADSTLDDVTGFDMLRNLRDAGLTGIESSTQTNGENGTVEGFELSYQQHFSMLPGFWGGFGVVLNYTYADSEQPNGNALEDISKDTYNAQIYWEGESFQTRLAYNYRSSYLDSTGEKRVSSIGKLGLGQTGDDTTAGNNIRDSRGQLDFSAAWDITDRITVVGNVVNLTEEPIAQITELGNQWQWRESDRRMSLGVRASF